MFAFLNRFQLTRIGGVYFQGQLRSTCAARDSMFHWSGRPVTGTSLVTLGCFSLFARFYAM